MKKKKKKKTTTTTKRWMNNISLNYGEESIQPEHTVSIDGSRVNGALPEHFFGVDYFIPRI